ncbi:MAG: type II secretion system F family protein [Planctomycetes bacterium]|nr:type II secretion system F family protein [Planctomycetota bacterium]MBL7143905.1 type II secretion system F family protein [Phycisphaerae bacterium]
MLEVIAIIVFVVYIYLGFKQPAIALVTSPFIALSIFVLGEAESAGAMVIAPFIFFATVISVSISKRDPDSERWPQICAKWFLYVFLCLLCSVTLIVAFQPLGVFALIFFIIFISLGIAYNLTEQHATATYIISTIGSSMRQNLPLPMALESAAGGRSDTRSIILQKIQKWLVQGYSLSESIKRGYPKCPGHAVAMIAAAEQINQLPLAIGAIEADMVTKADNRRRINPVHPLYPVILIVFTIFILLTVMKFVIPQIKSVLEEMVSGALPPATRLLIGIFNFFGHEFGWLIWSSFVLMILVVVPTSIYIRFRPRRPAKPYLLSRIGDYIKWHLPVLHWFEKNYSMVQVVELLRLSLNAGYTVDDTIKNTLELDVNNCFRNRLKNWLKRVKRGDDISTAVRESNLGSALAWAFDEQVNQGNTLSILETIESFYRTNYNYYVNLARFIMWPCITLIMGAMVGFVVYAIFSPGITVIRSLTGIVHP